MKTSSKTAAAGLVAAGVLVGAGLLSGPSAAAVDGRDDSVLWGSVTIPPGREGVLEVAGPTGSDPGAGATLTLTAPAGTRVTGLPLGAAGFTATLAADGRDAAYTAAGTSARPPGPAGTFPFVLAMPVDAVPGTRLSGCTLRLTDARGALRASGACQVTVGLAEPVLTRPEPGVPLGPRPEIGGTAHPGAQITVLDQEEAEVCSTSAEADGHWSCVPGPALPPGGNRLQAVATLNGVSATSEQIQITVTDAPAAAR
ncbi:carboxypeptidase regulatory-like domain-containing protein [Streptomyces sp. 15-116A]|uniref:carboxypeptidase regulatory-like domain-containing protein n=1 Tax=Streptomyces sp. 15-116A TaxID=2259035 RepID=UPI0021B2699E|nr:carboxypeptidase regulatory-like domain-containing protein [Streptomyces sp. 15-116A]MCT7355487.1 carboxypeptidase regulatory-like domain-containing protein [Streptomyces sp. 15-116A]